MYETNNLNITKGLGKGVFLPKNLFNPYHSSYSSYKNQSINLNLNQHGGSLNSNSNANHGYHYNGIKQLDYGLLFNLGVFTLFVCSLFYICVYRYRNKKKLKKEQELKQKQLLYEVKKQLEEDEKNQAIKKYNQMLEDKRTNQMMVNSNLDNIRNQMNNPYLLNQPNNYGIYDDKFVLESYKINNYQPSNLETPFFNSGSLMHW
jgi:hypothetical protein